MRQDRGLVVQRCEQSVRGARATPLIYPNPVADIQFVMSKGG